jgi:hypothetical protein
VRASSAVVGRCPGTGAPAVGGQVDPGRDAGDRPGALQPGTRLENQLMIEARQLQDDLDRQEETITLLGVEPAEHAAPVHPAAADQDRTGMPDSTVLMSAVPADDELTVRSPTPESLLMTIDEPHPPRRGLRRLFRR